MAPAVIYFATIVLFAFLIFGLSGNDELITAISKRDAELFFSLLEREVNLNAATSKGVTPLLAALQPKREEMALALINKPGVDVNAVEDDGDSALHAAIRHKLKACVQALLSKEADVNAANKRLETPLHYAARYGCADVVEWLLTKGAALEAKNKKGHTPLHVVTMYCMKHDASRILKILLEAGAETDVVDNVLETPLHYAARGPDEVFTVFLLSWGAKTNVKNKSGCTPLELALERGTEKVIRALIADGGMDVNSRLKNNNTALHYATDTSVLDFLLSVGGTVDVTNADGKTPLQLARERGFANVVRNLLEAGAEIEDPENLMRDLWPPTFEFAYETKFADFDDFITRSVQTAYPGGEMFGTNANTRVESIVESYQTYQIYALCRVLAVLYEQRVSKDRRLSRLETATNAVFRLVLTILTEKTYLGKLPAQVAKDALFQAGYYGWKFEAFSYGVVLASRTRPLTVKEVKELARNFIRESFVNCCKGEN